MKRMIVLSIMLLSLAIIYAHPAGNLAIKYDMKSQMLELNYAHKVKDAADHYINSVNVLVNGKTVLTHTLSLQESTEGGILSYKLPALKAGDKISISTQCNKGGKKSANLTLK
ncbi:MAG: thiosulfate oxidation carrier complex protein SoxZ [Candidatus Cloacimonetes bacterium]|nr:thiosulfate oxidation carrier complex protein SoxZ [Candidatus Cloacimonadota bacterium]MCK9333735.1 thiosulfate oxidation carrier complex protein SoxZ [Candidatus Cloacimonadota bacterium]MDD2542874.1 thiosulfate oxidation carrier complex protein SoxZ [Candidatus Cloacimonadota bacterium]MDD2682891.1 thiosulfate oxidation carrier complex protein SoxZ [Candidatus Cloacimonadota bacterium]MDD3096156.1 thiosulfate oxidation carrier complex protein SoxZ [Candidatus Cloacimonadota bacterium]